MIKTTVALAHLLPALALVGAITAGTFDVTPQLVLDPVGLLEVDHENIPLFLFHKMRCQLRSLFEAEHKLRDKTLEVDVRLRGKIVPEGKVQRGAIIGNNFKNFLAQLGGIGERVHGRSVPASYHETVYFVSR